MSLTAAVTNAASGLAATARGTLVIASNLANLRTPGYARRELVQSAFGASSPSGVRVDGINRIVNESIVAELRRADAATSESSMYLSYLKTIEETVGNSSSHGGLENLIYKFRDSLIKASSRPDDTVLTEEVIKSAQKVASKFNEISKTIDDQVHKANEFIETNVPALKESLAEIAKLNRRISTFNAQGRDYSVLQDLRQAEIAKINKLIPVQVQPRANHQVAIFSRKGAQLLDGIKPIDFSLPKLKSEYYSGGELAAAIEIIDVLSRHKIKELNEIAFNIVGVFDDVSGVSLDNDAGQNIFQLLERSNEEGSASKIVVNKEISESEPNTFWGGDVAVDLSSSEYHQSKFDKLKTYAGLFGDGVSGRNLSKIMKDVVQFGSKSATQRLKAEELHSENVTWQNVMSERYLETGVDSDAELQKLVQYQQIYSANARVIQAVQDMFDQIQRW